MALADDLVQLARRARKTKDYDYAVRLHHRAIDLRSPVRERDPSNAECHCLIAWNYRSIGYIETERRNFDAAVVSFQRALLIYEDLERRERNNKEWSELLAATARDLADVLGKRGDSQSAFMHADNAVRISRDSAERYSADSETRINHAKSLELVARLARDVANRDPESSESHFKLAVANLVGANAIRESVLVVDPSKGECRCQVGSNHMELANIYEDWGQDGRAPRGIQSCRAGVPRAYAKRARVSKMALHPCKIFIQACRGD
jgi:tetratricopeptide (TPR) repeat protein